MGASNIVLMAVAASWRQLTALRSEVVTVVPGRPLGRYTGV